MIKTYLKSIVIAVILLNGFVSKAVQLTEHPKAEISNGIVKAQILLPDLEHGYYKATRFDWSGVISNLDYKGHSYFGTWFDKDNHPAHATIMGPVEAYSPLNYKDVEVGDAFVKIGIGALLKSSNESHSDFIPYKIVDPGIWELKMTTNSVEFIHKLSNGGYAYEYIKTIELVENQPKMIISHRLKNTGLKTISTVGFNHNFLVLDNQPIGKGVELSFPVAVSGSGRGEDDMFAIQGKKLVFLRLLDNEESFACKYLEGLNSVEDFDIRLENHNSRAGVRITGDYKLPRLRLWGNAKTVCPETYINLKVEAGEDYNWSYDYEFYETAE
ncbi:hypothetical protein ACFFVB_06290 [Formosa undariae]|uniref:Uncharacterized protein n=1 Tax=Formosa undariae TaxID=1325436 RepID=A0ABV5EZS0_9FLAO